MNHLLDRVRHLQARIEKACESSGRDPGTVEVLPVSKRQAVSLIREASMLGFRTFGENYVQEGLAKAQELPDLRFILIGPLQRNKTKHALLHFQELMTVDRESLANRLIHTAEDLAVSRPAWIQVDLWNEGSKVGGCATGDLAGLIATLEAAPQLPFRGFMAIPPPGNSEAFHELSRLRQDWQQRLGRHLRLSMGMSDDLEAAIAAGSDQVRIGTALFGDRG